MKKYLLILGLLFSVCVSAQIDKVIPKRPSPPKLVNDFTHTLQPYQVEALEQKLVKYDDSTSNQVAVVIISTLGDYSERDVALEILRRWGVGNKDKNNGIVFLVAIDDRKMRIEIGYGLEGTFSDITAKDILENEVKPSFKEKNYYRGIDRGTNAIMQATAGEYTAPANYGSKKKSRLPWGSIIFVAIFIIIGIMGGGRSGGGTYVSRGGYTGWGGGGWSGGGGGSSGGSSFGGFGGGSGGGGGASGSW